MIDSFLQRAIQLIETKRYIDAEQQLRDALAQEPQNSQTMSLLSVCKAETGALTEAIALIKRAIASEPDNDYYLYLHALFLVRSENVKAGEQMVRNAIAFNPANASYHGLLANIKLQQKEWQVALDQANQGLSIDAENLACLNARATALAKLNKSEESFETIREALQQDPENDYTHANIGWAQLERGEVQQALESFRTALKFNPQNELAKSGLVEALKARYLFYRWFLKYAFWIGNLKAKGQWFFIIGIYVGIRLLNSVADTNSEYAVFIKPIVYLYFVFALSTWIIDPLSNLVLRLNVYGRYALTRNEIVASNFVGISLGLAALSGVYFLVTASESSVVFMIYFAFMMIPLGSMMKPTKKSSRQLLVVLTVAIGIVGALGVLIPGMSLWYIFLIGVIGYQWVANAVLIR